MQVVSLVGRKQMHNYIHSTDTIGEMLMIACMKWLHWRIAAPWLLHEVHMRFAAGVFLDCVLLFLAIELLLQVAWACKYCFLSKELAVAFALAMWRFP